MNATTKGKRTRMSAHELANVPKEKRTIYINEHLKGEGFDLNKPVIMFEDWINHCYVFTQSA